MTIHPLIWAIFAPPDFDPERMAEYAYADGVLVLSVPAPCGLFFARKIIFT